jgi:hypothetical protein
MAKDSYAKFLPYPTLKTSESGIFSHNNQLKTSTNSVINYRYSPKLISAPKPAPTKSVLSAPLKKLKEPIIIAEKLSKGGYFSSSDQEKKISPLDIVIEDENNMTLRNIKANHKYESAKNDNGKIEKLFENLEKNYNKIALSKNKKKQVKQAVKVAQAKPKIVSKAPKTIKAPKIAKVPKAISKNTKTAFTLPINRVGKASPAQKKQIKITTNANNDKQNFVIPIAKNKAKNFAKKDVQLASINKKSNFFKKVLPEAKVIKTSKIDKINIPSKPEETLWKPSSSLIGKSFSQADLKPKKTADKKSIKKENNKTARNTYKDAEKTTVAKKTNLLNNKEIQVASVWSKLPIDSTYYQLDKNIDSENEPKSSIYGEKLESSFSKNKTHKKTKSNKARFIKASANKSAEQKKPAKKAVEKAQPLLKPIMDFGVNTENKKDDKPDFFINSAPKSPENKNIELPNETENAVDSLVSTISSFFDGSPSQNSADNNGANYSADGDVLSDDSIFLKKNKKKRKSTILPAEIKLAFQNDKASISGHTLRWINAFAQKVANDNSLGLEIRMSKIAPSKLRTLRFSLLRNILLSKGVNDFQIHPIFTDRQPNTLVIRTFSIKNIYNYTDSKGLPSTQLPTNQYYTNW